MTTKKSAKPDHKFNEYEEIIDCYVFDEKIIPSEVNNNLFKKILKNAVSLTNIDVLWNIATHPKRAAKYFKTSDLALIIGAVIYTIAPLDALPDWLPGGFIDDIGVVNYVLRKCDVLLSQYRFEFMNKKAIELDEI